MSLPSSFTIRPTTGSSKPPGGVSSNKVEDTESNNMASSSFRTIQLSFSSSQEDEVQAHHHQGRTTSTAVVPDDSRKQHHAVAVPPFFLAMEDPYARRSIRVSPFEPMAHLRRMPRNGTISPLRIEEYQVEMARSSQHRHPRDVILVNDQSPGASSKNTSSNGRPPLEEVRIPAPSPSSSCDGTFTSAISPPSAKDYKALYLQSQKDLESLQKAYRALQKLQERTLGENHLLRSRVKVLVKRHQQQAASSASGKPLPSSA